MDDPTLFKREIPKVLENAPSVCFLEIFEVWVQRLFVTGISNEILITIETSQT